MIVEQTALNQHYYKSDRAMVQKLILIIAQLRLVLLLAVKQLFCETTVSLQSLR